MAAAQLVNGNNFILLRETWGHMSAVSGFDPLFEAVNAFPGVSACNLFVPPTSPPPALIAKVLNFLGMADPERTGASSDPSYMQPRHRSAALEVLRYAVRERDALIVLSAAENQYCSHLSSADAAIRSRLVLCLHQPPSWLRLHWRDFSAFDGLRALVCFSAEQQRFLSGVTGTPVLRIRHGVRHDFFTPAEAAVQGARPALLFVGQWLRDFDTLHASMQRIWAARPEVQLDCVIPRQARNLPALHNLARDARVRWHADIAPEALRELYRRAALLFLPLLDAAANNAVVEAMACGLPLVATAVGGIGEHLPADAATLCPVGDADAHAAAVLAWLDDDARRKAAGRSCRDFAVTHLDWPTIAGSLVEQLGFARGVD